MLINGEPGTSVHLQDRGLQYGDGVFRTMRIHDGRVLHWRSHFEKLRHDCLALNIHCPSEQLLAEELSRLIALEHKSAGVAKIIITRGNSVRGFAPPTHPTPTRIISISELPKYPAEYYESGVRLHVCNLRLAHQPRLAGIKHLNRLENVLAAGEWHDPQIAEGVLLDQDDNVIEGTRSNLFCVKDGDLYTPDLSQCGVAGMQRDRVIKLAWQHKLRCHITQVTLHNLQAADEIFVVNSVIGLWPVRELLGRHFAQFPISNQLIKWLQHEDN